MKQRIPARTALRAGQSLHMHAPLGMTIIAAQGAASICSAPVWLGEQMMHERFLLREGEPHAVRSTGWVAVSAQTDVQLVCIGATATFGSLLDQLIGWLTFMVRRRSL